MNAASTGSGPPSIADPTPPAEDVLSRTSAIPGRLNTEIQIKTATSVHRDRDLVNPLHPENDALDSPPVRAVASDRNPKETIEGADSA